jgi:hypothetical protein
MAAVRFITEITETFPLPLRLKLAASDLLDPVARRR